MKNIFRNLILAAVVCGSACSAGSASAQGFGSGHGGGYSHGGHFHGGGSLFPSTLPRWHDTTHLDYHPAHLQQHGNHFDFVPGHYDLHRTGHWHP